MKKLAYLLPVCGLFCLTSCEKKDTPPIPPPPNPSAYYTADAGSTLNASPQAFFEPASHIKPGDQADSYADRPWLKKIRLALSEDKELSPYAQQLNVVIIKGTVRLKGFVPNAQVRDQLIKKIKQVVGNRTVEDQLEVS